MAKHSALRWIVYNNNYEINGRNERNKVRNSSRPWVVKRADTKIWRTFGTQEKAFAFALEYDHKDNQLKEEGIRE